MRTDSNETPGERPRAATIDPEADTALDALLGCFPRAGRVEWLGLRPAKRGRVLSVEQARALAGLGLEGDHFAARAGGGSGAGTRQVTLIQAEHLAVIGALVGQGRIAPARLRRNIVVAGINLLALKDRLFQIGEAVLEGSGLAHPCSRMEQELGPGGYNAMRGHGGLTARVIEGGLIRVGDRVRFFGKPRAGTD